MTPRPVTHPGSSPVPADTKGFTIVPAGPTVGDVAEAEGDR